MNSPAAGCALAYANFAAALSYPDEATLESIRSGHLAGFFRELLDGAGEQTVTDWDVLAGQCVDVAALQEEFTRLFEAGESGPPCPLLESHYRGSELTNLEELVRYYDFFGLSLPEDRQVRPDHLCTQLEFLHFLAFHEAGASDSPEAVAGLARTQRDFIERHVGAWIPLLRAAVTDRAESPFFPELLGLLGRFLQAESLRLGNEVGQA